MSVNEVNVAFYATDKNNLLVSDLKPDEIDLFDNDQGPGHIVAFQSLAALPLRVAFVIDTSQSIASNTARSRVEAIQAVNKFVTQPEDEGIVVEFAGARRVAQFWTGSKDELATAISRIGPALRVVAQRTSLYDTLFSTCVYDFGADQTSDTTNVILLFSDGEDTGSYMTLQTVIDKCRQLHTIVYSFSPKPLPGSSTAGLLTLRQITELTGGSAFFDSSGTDVTSQIDTLGKSIRSRYRLIYQPRSIKKDGSFHKIVLVGPKRVDRIIGTTGYYAPSR